MFSTIEKLGGRKMIIGTLGLIVLTVLAAFKPEAITAQFITGLLGIIAAFNIANVTNTMKALTNPSAQPPTSPNEDSDENKVNYLNLQSQIDTTTKQIEVLADIIQKSMLTRQANAGIVYTQAPIKQQPVEMAQGSNADTNRQAISQYLSGTPS